MLCKITISKCLQKIRRGQARARKLWPNVRYADTLPIGISRISYQELIKRSNGNPCLTAGKDLKRFRDWSKNLVQRKLLLLLRAGTGGTDCMTVQKIFMVSQPGDHLIFVFVPKVFSSTPPM